MRYLVQVAWIVIPIRAPSPFLQEPETGSSSANGPLLVEDTSAMATADGSEEGMCIHMQTMACIHVCVFRS